MSSFNFHQLTHTLKKKSKCYESYLISIQFFNNLNDVCLKIHFEKNTQLQGSYPTN